MITKSAEARVAERFPSAWFPSATTGPLSGPPIGRFYSHPPGVPKGSLLGDGLLIRARGALVATTTTGNNGSYRFQRKVGETVRLRVS